MIEGRKKAREVGAQAYSCTGEHLHFRHELRAVVMKSKPPQKISGGKEYQASNGQENVTVKSIET